MDENLYKGKYRIKSTRLKHWDYSSNGTYYVTICTKNREYYFGNIVNGKIVLSAIGRIVENYWLEIPQHYRIVDLDEFIIMPNHLHGIIVIKNPAPVETPHWGVSTGKPHRNPHHKIQWKPNSVGSMICQFKSIATKQIREIGFYNFAWQSRFHEHIIRDEIELNQKRNYIINNPLKWKFKKNEL